MYTIELTDQELRIVDEALEAYLEEFGHDEAETERLIKAVIARVKSARVA
ncbi:MAG TPA: hypothetical protein VFC31_00980 [Candidatus Limnocylindria bacterium]|nr:hypothetical protein [Candidatus Limnocylindria bacterium]